MLGSLLTYGNDGKHRIKIMIKKIIYVLIVIGAFWLGHYYGEKAVNVIDELPVPKITIEMPSGEEIEIETPVATEEVRG